MALIRDALQSIRPGSVRGTAGGYRVGQSLGGRWWFLDPADRPLWVRAVNEVRPGVSENRALDGAEAAEPSAAEAGRELARLRAWGCNALGPGGEPALTATGAWPWFAPVEFATAGPLIRFEGVRLPDVFDPAWPAAAAARAAEVCLPWAARRDLIGWVTDRDLHWAQPVDPLRPSLLQVCLSLEPSFTAYHAAWEFVLALHGGRLEALASAWGERLANREGVRDRTRSGVALSGAGYRRDEERWTQEFARRHFALAAAAIRVHAPAQLVLGALGAGDGAGVLEGAHAACDAVWWSRGEVPEAINGPLVAGAFSWAVGEDGPKTGPWRTVGGLTTIERRLRDGRAALERLAGHPAVAGYAWAHWADAEGERAPFARGLVHRDGAEAREHTELLADLNPRLHALRASHSSSPFP